MQLKWSERMQDGCIEGIMRNVLEYLEYLEFEIASEILQE